MITPSVEELKSTTFGGRRFTRKQITGIQQTVKTFITLSRRELAHTVCEYLQWQTPNGNNKVQSCLDMLENLEALGILSLPPKKTSMQRGSPKQIVPTDLTKEQAGIDDKLSQLTPIRLQVVTEKDDITLWNEFIDRHHYLGYKRPIGPHMRYFIVDHQNRKLGCLMFSYASKTLACRDEWIGWQDKPYKKHLDLIVNNNRFLILPWVTVKNLASKILSIAARQLADDWHAAHGYRPVLLETFIDSTKFNASCYRAANWHHLGQTQKRASKTTKAVYVYPLLKNAKSILINGPTKPVKKRAARAVKTGHSNDPFIQLWQNIISTVTTVASDFDAQWQKRRRTLNTLLVVLFIFRLVFSKNNQGYGITIAELWNQCQVLNVSLPQSSPVAASAFCAARSKMDEKVFNILHREILKDYNRSNREYRWKGHEIFAVDGSKMNLPRPLIKQGYRIPSDNAHYPQGLVSCLYQLKSKIPIDFELVSHGDERKLALTHLAFVSENDVVVYDRGYFSYAMLEAHVKKGIHPVFRLKNKANKVVDLFIASDEKDEVIEIPNPEARKNESGNTAIPLRLVKYTEAGTTYILGTTLLDPEQYPVEDLSDIYHSRWGIEELYKVSKQLMTIEEFHAQSERGVKQELFAHFILITLTRIFSNHSEDHFNSSSYSKEDKETKANFKNALVTMARHIEGLLLQQSELVNKTINTIIESISWCRQKVRPNRSYDRRSRKPIGKWKPPKPAKPANKVQPITA
jgi:hypothetical protein